MTEGPTAPTFKYNDLVLYNQRGKICNALVLKSQLVPVPNPKSRGTMINEEHLTITYLDPFLTKPPMSQIEMEQARKGPIEGIREYTDENQTGWMRVKVIVEDGSEAGVEQKQYAGRHQNDERT